MRQYVLEIEYTMVFESVSEDPEEVSDNFAALLTELAATNDHILGLSVNVLPIPELRSLEPLDQRDEPAPAGEA